MKILEMESLRVEEMEQLTILQTLLLIFWMICFLGRKVCERLLAWLEFMLSGTMTFEQVEGPIDEGIVSEHSQDVSSVETSRVVEEPSRVVVAETIRSEQLHQLLLPSLPNDLFVHHI
jgi:hypothetical protein